MSKHLKRLLRQLESKLKQKEIFLSNISSSNPEYTCPILQEIMTNPVILLKDSSKHCYQKEAILAWGKINNTSPITNEKCEINESTLIQNSKLLESIKADHPIVSEISWLREKIESTKNKINQETRSNSLRGYYNFYDYTFFNNRSNTIRHDFDCDYGVSPY